MKKIGLLILVMLSLVIMTKFVKVEKVQKNVKTKEQVLLETNKVKYNKHIRFYNRILSIDKGLLYYFEDAGMERTIDRSQLEDIELNIPIDQEFINKLKTLEESNDKKDDLDKKAIAMLPVLEKMLPISESMKNYYKNKQYLKDNFSLGENLHGELLDNLEKYNSVAKAYKEAFEKKSKEVKNLMEKDYDKRKFFITYRQLVYIDSGEDFINEIRRQKLDASNFTIKGNDKDLKKIFDKIDKSLLKLEKSVKNEKQMKKEGFDLNDHNVFITKAKIFKDSANRFITRIKKKEKATYSSVSDGFYAQTEEGTPENVVATFNEVVKEHNRLLAKQLKNKK